MKQRIINKILLSAGLLPGIAYMANAQAPHSYETNISGFNIPAGYTVTSLSETMYMGANNPVTFQTDGLDSIFSKNVWISPLATITGIGSMSFNDPSVAGGTSGATTVDGNNNPITITNLSNNNPSGIILSDIADTEFSTTNPTGTSAAALVITGNTLTLRPSGASITLNGYDLSLGSTTNFVNAGADRLVITGNSSTAHLIKQNQSSPFLFPVGIAANDYTPATITPTTTATNVYVAVQDYTQVPKVSDNKYAINRSWNIYGTNSIPAKITLQHNSETEGSGFVQNASYITDFTSGSWAIPIPADDAGSTLFSIGINTSAIVSLLASSGSANAYYTVTNSSTPLPIPLVKPLTATLNGGCSGVVLSWTTGVENNFDHFTLYASTDNKNFTIIAQPAGKGSGSSYSFTQANPESGINYYQLTGTDKDGSITFYGTTSINVGCAVVTNVYPNPATTQLNVKVPANGNYQLISEMGTPVLNGSLQAGTNKLNIGNLSEGAYILRVMTNNSINNYKVIIKK
ncbi:MAG: T9SS type A sorting domain-containing protein [Chitinophagaceae bacterium]|jgi:hypothetical protein|nr:T9SS type A sorting domain-containing protein [Chitinophagaceae bacterium]